MTRQGAGETHLTFHQMTTMSEIAADDLMRLECGVASGVASVEPVAAVAATMP